MKGGEADTDMVSKGANLMAVKQPLGQQTVALLHHSRKSHLVNFPVFGFKHLHQLSLVFTATLPCHWVAKIQVYMAECYKVISHIQKGETCLLGSSLSSISVPETKTLL